jgi:acyl carrier protein
LGEQVSRWLREWFASRAKAGARSSAEMLDVNYFEAGLLTSAEVVEFVTEIEEKFGMQFSESDLSDERFVTISGLSQLIEHRLQASQAK